MIIDETPDYSPERYAVIISCQASISSDSRDRTVTLAREAWKDEIEEFDNSEIFEMFKEDTKYTYFDKLLITPLL